MDIRAWCGGKNIDEVCPEDLKDDWKNLQKILKSHVKSHQMVGLPIDDRFWKILPKHFTSQREDLKEFILEDIKNNINKPLNYNFLINTQALIDKITSQKLKINKKALNVGTAKARRFYKKLDRLEPCVKYNLYGTKTGRLTVESGYFPILNLDKEHRCVLTPQNDFFVELDFNSAELRVVFYLMGQEQPDLDIHNWIKDNVYKTKITRDRLKSKTFAWLYNPQAENHRLESFIDRRKLVKKYYINGRVETPFDRSLEVEPNKALNYLIQSTTADLVLRQALKVDECLENKKSKIAFIVHDSVVLDMSKDEVEELVKSRLVLDIFKKTDFGDFKINMAVGTNYGKMSKCDI